MKAVMIIPPRDFRDEELFEPRQILEQAGIQVVVASLTLKPAKGMLGAVVTPDITIDKVKAADFDAVIFVGGSGADCYWDNPLARQIAQDAYNSGNIIAASCIAPVTLANAGILKNKSATVWPSTAKDIKAKGAIYTAKPVERDGNIVTGKDPAAAKAFGEAIVKALMEKISK